MERQQYLEEKMDIQREGREHTPIEVKEYNDNSFATKVEKHNPSSFISKSLHTRKRSTKKFVVLPSRKIREGSKIWDTLKE